MSAAYCGSCGREFDAGPNGSARYCPECRRLRWERHEWQRRRAEIEQSMRAAEQAVAALGDARRERLRKMIEEAEK